jgi:hypothetical protein
VNGSAASGDGHRPADLVTDPPSGPGEVAHAAMRGAIAAMAMTGMRTFTSNMGMVERAPPEAIFKERVPGLIRRVPGRAGGRTA